MRPFKIQTKAANGNWETKATYKSLSGIYNSHHRLVNNWRAVLDGKILFEFLDRKKNEAATGQAI